MVTGAILHALANAASWLLGLIPSWTPPSWLGDLVTFMGGVVSNALQLGNWIPWPLVGAAFLIVWTATGVALAVRIGRIVASFLTAGGGGAA